MQEIRRFKPSTVSRRFSVNGRVLPDLRPRRRLAAFARGWTGTRPPAACATSPKPPVSRSPGHIRICSVTRVTTTLDAGADLRDVQIAARHADPRTTTMRYEGPPELGPAPELHPGRLHGLRHLNQPAPPAARTRGRRPALPKMRMLHNRIVVRLSAYHHRLRQSKALGPLFVSVNGRPLRRMCPAAALHLVAHYSGHHCLVLRSE
jgi:hypothetical protein